MTKPPVPKSLDVRDCPRMPLDIVKLKNSDTWGLATGDEFRCAIALWMAAWHQVPAGSLPDDDRLLARYSEAGTNWPEMRAVALRNFVKCSDDRLYHPVICEAAVKAAKTMAARRKGGKSAQQKRKKGQLSSSSAQAAPPAQLKLSSSSAQAQLEVKERKGNIESRGGDIYITTPRARARQQPSACSPEGLLEDDSQAPLAAASEADAQADVQHAMRVLERVLEICGANGSYTGTVHDVLGWLGAGYDPDLDILPTVEAVAARPNFKPPRSNLRYFTPAIREAHERRTAAGGEAAPTEPVAPMTDAQRDEMHRNWCLLFEERGFWPETLSPRPGQLGCEVPERIWREFPRLVERLGLDDEPDAGAPRAAAATP